MIPTQLQRLGSMYESGWAQGHYCPPGLPGLLCSVSALLSEGQEYTPFRGYICLPDIFFVFFFSSLQNYFVTSKLTCEPPKYSVY